MSIILLGITFLLMSPFQTQRLSPEAAKIALPGRSHLALASIANLPISQAPDVSSVHPVKGVRFSPDSNVTITDTVLTAEQLRNFNGTEGERRYGWGNYDGSGGPILLTVKEYFNRFVNDKDYLFAPVIAYNEIKGRGNSINNIFEFYPNSVVVEYHFPAPGNSNDWKSLWLVFEQYQGNWLLIGVVHGEWTI